MSSNKLRFLLWTALLIGKATADNTCPGKEDIFPEGAVLADGLCAQIYLNTADLVSNVSRPRSLAIKEKEVFCLERGGFYEEWQTLTGYVMVYDDEDNDGTADKSTVLANLTSLDHGLAVSDTHLYASTAMAVHRWPYTKGSRDFIADSLREVVIKDIPSSDFQRHSTRTIVLDGDDDVLYVAIGSENNTDVDSRRANVRRFNLSDDVALPIAFEEGEIYADGVRNAVGLGFDKFGILWGVENGADSAFREDLGGDINEDNPADEMLRFVDKGAFYGFPYCFTEYNLSTAGMGTGTQWAWENFTEEPFGDEWCRLNANNVPPEVALQAHSAPLGITFYKYQEEWPNECPDGVAFPKEWDGHAFITYHGSYFREVPIGAKVMRVPMTDGGLVDGGIDLEPSVVMEDMDLGPEWLSGIRPVDVKFDQCGRLLVSSDGSYYDQDGRMIILIQSTPPNNDSTSAATTSTGLLVALTILALLVHALSW